MYNYCYGFTIYVFTITVTALQGLCIATVTALQEYCINVTAFQELCTTPVPSL